MPSKKGASKEQAEKKPARKLRTIEAFDPKTGDTYRLAPIAEVYEQFVQDFKIGREHALRFRPVPASSLMFDRSLVELAVAGLNSGILPESLGISVPKIAHIGAMEVELINLQTKEVVGNGISKSMRTHPAVDPNANARMRASAVRDLLTNLGYLPYSSSLDDEELPQEEVIAEEILNEEEKPEKETPQSEMVKNESPARRKAVERASAPTRAQMLLIELYAQDLGVEVRQPIDRNDARQIMAALRKARESGDTQDLKPYLVDKV